MNLNFSNGDVFTTGAIRYSYSPATVGETTNRIIIPIEIEGVKTQAVVDTGAPYVVVSPRIAKLAGLNSTLGSPDFMVITRSYDIEIVGVRNQLLGTVATATVSPNKSKNSTLYPVSKPST